MMVVSSITVEAGVEIGAIGATVVVGADVAIGYVISLAVPW
jgi:hypothetical protein